MATKHSRKSRKSRKSLFSCFLFSPCFGRDDSGPAANKKPPRNTGPKKSPWWKRLRARNSGRKTVPVDTFSVEDATRGPDKDDEINEEIVAVEVEEDGNPSAGDHVSDYGVVDNKARKAPDPQTPAKRDTYHKPLSIGRRTDSRKTGGSRPESPDSRTGRSFPTTCSTYPPSGSRRRSHPAGSSRLSGRKPTPSVGSDAPSGKSDAVVGMSVLMVALAVVMLWGRICAIICTSAWFYFVPRLRTATDPGGTSGGKDGGGDPDVDSSEYKKKVIMAGLLERSRR